MTRREEGRKIRGLAALRLDIDLNWTWICIWANSRRWWTTEEPGCVPLSGVAKSQTWFSNGIKTIQFEWFLAYTSFYTLMTLNPCFLYFLRLLSLRSPLLPWDWVSPYTETYILKSYCKLVNPFSCCRESVRWRHWRLGKQRVGKWKIHHSLQLCYCLVARSCLIFFVWPLRSPSSLQGFSAHGISQARTLSGLPFSTPGSSWTQN